MTIATGALARIVGLAQASLDREICGLLLGRNGIEEARVCRNVHPTPETRFELDPAALLAAHRAGRAGGPSIIGHFHSHPSCDPTPSATDAAHAAPDGSLWLIVAGGEVRAWQAVRGGALHDRFDSVALRVVADPAKWDR